MAVVSGLRAFVSHACKVGLSHVVRVRQTFIIQGLEFVLLVVARNNTPCRGNGYFLGGNPGGARYLGAIVSCH